MHLILLSTYQLTNQIATVILFYDQLSIPSYTKNQHPGKNICQYTSLDPPEGLLVAWLRIMYRASPLCLGSPAFICEDMLSRLSTQLLSNYGSLLFVHFLCTWKHRFLNIKHVLLPEVLPTLEYTEVCKFESEHLVSLCRHMLTCLC